MLVWPCIPHMSEECKKLPAFQSFAHYHKSKSRTKKGAPTWPTVLVTNSKYHASASFDNGRAR